MMFQVGEYIQYGNNGVCKVDDITRNVSGVGQDRVYYILVPVEHSGSRIYTPVDNKKVVMRKLLTPEEVEMLMSKIPDIPELRIADDKIRESKYKEALLSGDSERWIQVMKTVHLRRERRIAQGRKITATDERYWKSAEERLCGELAFALGREKEQVKNYLREKFATFVHVSQGSVD